MKAVAAHDNDLDDDSETLEMDALRVPSEPEVPRRLVVPAGNDGERLDKTLALLLPAVSRTRIKQWIEEGAVRLNDRTAVPRAEVLAGDSIDLAPAPSPQATALRPESIALDVVHADRSIIVLVKPPGLVVHPAAGHWSGTLLNGLLAYDPALGRLPRAGIVHRLDADTSGLMVVARTAAAQIDLVRQLQARTVTREYWAIAYGSADSRGTIDAAIARDPRNPLRFRTSTVAKAKPARTRYRRVDRRDVAGRAFSWLACRLETGRTHQIRVHLESIGLPLVGDPLYVRGRPNAPKTTPTAWSAFERQALHACRLALTHPRSGKAVQWFNPPPSDMRDLMTALGFDPHQRVDAFE
jgi:23S rRNA pseudouridine1911/1915/1917 synthase